MNDEKPITLMLLPGMHGSGLLFTPFTRELPDFIKPAVVTYPPDRPLDYEGHLKIVMAALPDNEPFVLLGESFSGPLALMAAARNPRGLRGVILCSTFVRYPLALPAALAGALLSLGLFRLLSPRLLVRILLKTGTSDEIKNLFFRAVSCVQPAVLTARARAVLDLDVTVQLRECAVPILVIQARNDRIVSRKSYGQLRSLRPDAETVVIDGPHLILQCAATEASREIRRFLERILNP